MELFYRTLGKGQPVIILHGIFGTSDNWQTFGKKLADDRYKVYLIDQRNHGNSPHSDQFDYQVLSNDIKDFSEQHQLNKPVVLGHSMGGKAALFFGVQYPELYDKLIVVDMAPKAYPVRHDNIIKALEAVKIDSIQHRKEAEEQLAVYIQEPGVRQFLMKNLKRTEQGFSWKLNLQVISEKLENIAEGLPTDQTTDKPVLFIRGEKSDYITAEDEATIKKQFSNARLVTIPGAGHWVHAEQPEMLYKEIEKFLKE